MIVLLLIGLALIGHALAGSLGAGIALVVGVTGFAAVIAWTDPWR